MAMLRDEEIAWESVNNLTARLGTRLAGSGLFLAVTSFMIGGLLAVAVDDQTTKTSLANFGASDWVRLLWALNFVALGVWGMAFWLFLRSAIKFWAAQKEVNLGVTGVVDVYRDPTTQQNDSVDLLQRAYFEASERLLVGVSLVESGTYFLYVGMAFSLVAFVVWAYLTI